MATSPLRLQQGYGIGNALQPLPPFTIIANRAPTQQDRARIGTFWTYTAANNVYVLTSVTGGLSNWLTLSNGGAGIFISLEVNGLSEFNGNITQTAGVTSLLQTTINGSLTQNGGATLLNTDALAQTVNIGTGAAAKTVSLGSTNTTSTTTINSGSGNINLNGSTVISKAGLVLQTNCTAGGAVSVRNVQTSDDNAGVIFHTLKRYTTGTITNGDRLLSFGIFGQENNVDISAATIDSVAVDVGAGRVSGDLGFATKNLAGVEARRLVISTEGQVNIETAGQTLAVQGGAVTDFIGQAVLAAGTVTVNNTNITAADKIFLSVSLPGGTQGILSYAIAAGASFTITSTNALDTSTVEYFIVRQI